MHSRFRQTAGQAAMLLALGQAALAQDIGASYTTFGTTGLLEMPTAESAAPGEIAATLSYSGSGGTKTTFSFQLTDRFSGSFRYAVMDQYQEVTTPGIIPDTYETFDRSFDLEYRLSDQNGWWPATAIGLRDFLGTGRFSSEYIVASRAFGPQVKVTGGLGWGRMGTHNGFANPLSILGEQFETRPAYVDREFADPGEANGGTIAANQFFRGDAAFFGGIEYQMTPTLGFKAEYSSISYPVETFTPAIDYRSPWNVGLTWRPRPGTQVNLAYLYGSELSASASFVINPMTRPTRSGYDPAPAPVRVRNAEQLAARSWDQVKQPEPAVRAGLTQLLAVEGIELLGLQITDTTARLRYQNNRYRTEAQAMGRATRMMTQIIPPSVNRFVLEPSQRGMPLAAVTIDRRMIEAEENRVGAAATVQNSAGFDAANPAPGLITNPPGSPRFKWGLAPYTQLILFDKSRPVNVDIGLALDARYQIAPNLVAAGRVQQSALGAQDPLDFFDNPNDYVNVRTDLAYFGRDGQPTLENLTLAHYGRVAPDVYSRVTAGYLERMYGGVSTELLWKPVNSRLALGAELNYTKLRDQNVGFGFALYETEPGTGARIKAGQYDVVTGHLSAYYDIGGGYHAQLDAGKYLAGDWGASFALDREFSNGWSVGGYFTLTDMPFGDFGEGSFDKGIRVSIPFDYFIGTPSRKSVNTTLQSLTRDGGARVNVEGRLYDIVRQGHSGDLSDSWGRFWR